MSTPTAHIYEVRPRSDKRGFDLISNALPFGRLWYAEPDAISNAIGCAKFFSRSHDAVIRVYDEDGNVIQDARASGRFQRAVAVTVCDFEQNKSRHDATVDERCSPAVDQIPELNPSCV